MAFYISVVLVNVIVIGYFWKKFDLQIQFQFNRDAFRELLGKGFPMLIGESSMILITTAGQILVPILLSNKELGYFGIATMLIGFLQNLPGTAREILEPRLMRSMADTPSEHVIRDYLLRPFVNTAYLLPFVIGPLLLVLPVVVPVLLPRYSPGIPAIQILLCGFYFLALSDPANALMFAFHWQVKSLVFMPLVLVVNVALSVLFVRQGMGVGGVALGSSISYGLLFISYLVFIATQLKARGRDWASHVAGTFVPFPVMLLTIWGLFRLTPHLVANRYLGVVLNVVILWLVLFGLHRLAGTRLVLLKEISLP